MRELIVGKTDYKKELNKTRDFFREYILNAKLQSVVLGVSGGIDSALVAAIVKPVCDEIKIPLIGVSLPSLSNKKDEQDRADMVGRSLCTNYITRNIENYFHILNYDLGSEDRVIKEEKIRKGNIKARIRMIILYDIAFKNKGLVLSTDNLTEYYLGFWTIFGDQGDLGLIQNIWKTEVYALAEYIIQNEYDKERDYYNRYNALDECIEAVPTDGLGITSSDLEQIGVKSYLEVDIILNDWIRNKKGDKNHPVIQRYERTHFKRNHPCNLILD